MAIPRRRQVEQGLQQPVDMRRGEEINAAGNVGHAFRRIVNRHRQVIAGRHLLARQNDIAERGRVGGDAPLAFDPFERPGARQRRADIEAQRVIGRRCSAFGALGRAEAAADAG